MFTLRSRTPHLLVALAAALALSLAAWSPPDGIIDHPTSLHVGAPYLDLDASYTGYGQIIGGYLLIESTDIEMNGAVWMHNGPLLKRSPNGSWWSCGPSNTGAWTCAAYP